MLNVGNKVEYKIMPSKFVFEIGMNLFVWIFCCVIYLPEVWSFIIVVVIIVVADQLVFQCSLTSYFAAFHP